MIKSSNDCLKLKSWKQRPYFKVDRQIKLSPPFSNILQEYPIPTPKSGLIKESFFISHFGLNVNHIDNLILLSRDDEYCGKGVGWFFLNLVTCKKIFMVYFVAFREKVKEEQVDRLLPLFSKTDEEGWRAGIESILVKPFEKMGKNCLKPVYHFIQNKKKNCHSKEYLIGLFGNIMVNCKKNGDIDSFRKGTLYLNSILSDYRKNSNLFNSSVAICLKKTKSVNCIPLLKKVFKENRIDEVQCGNLNSIIVGMGEKLSLSDPDVRKCGHCDKPLEQCRYDQEQLKKTMVNDLKPTIKEKFKEEKFKECVELCNLHVWCNRFVYDDSILEIRSRCYFQFGFFAQAYIDYIDSIHIFKNKDNFDKQYLNECRVKTFNVDCINKRENTRKSRYSFKKNRTIKKIIFRPREVHHSIQTHTPGTFDDKRGKVYIYNPTSLAVSVIDLESKREKTYRNVFQEVSDFYVTKTKPPYQPFVLMVGRWTRKIAIFSLENNLELKKKVIFQSNHTETLEWVRCCEKLNLVFSISKSEINVFCLNTFKLIKEIRGLQFIRWPIVVDDKLIVADSTKIVQFNLKSFKREKIFFQKDYEKVRLKLIEFRSIFFVNANKNYICASFKASIGLKDNFSIFNRENGFEEHRITMDCRVSNIFVHSKTNFVVFGTNKGNVFIVDCVSGSILSKIRCHREWIIRVFAKVKRGNLILYSSSKDGTILVKEIMKKERFCESCKKREQKVVFKWCGRCKAVSYCCRDCQIKHWLSHKKVCINMKK